jgi:hypothetical protein
MVSPALELSQPVAQLTASSRWLRIIFAASKITSLL